MIEGQSGFAAIIEQGVAVLPALMRPVVSLHRMASTPNLRDFEPLKKINARLDPGLRRALAPALAAALDDIGGVPRAKAIIHGDLHAGQFLIDGGGDAWLLDLDDLAVGAPAADLGNFAAHLATQARTGTGNPLARMRRWLVEVIGAYRDAGGDADIWQPTPMHGSRWCAAPSSSRRRVTPRCWWSCARTSPSDSQARRVKPNFSMR